MRERRGRSMRMAGMAGLIVAACAQAEPGVAPAKAAEELKMAPFGSVAIVRPSGKMAASPKHIVLWIADGATTEASPVGVPRSALSL